MRRSWEWCREGWTMYWRRARQTAVLAVLLAGLFAGQAKALTLVPPKPNVLLRRQRPGDDRRVQRIRRPDGEAPGPAGDLPSLGQQPQRGLRTLAGNGDAAGPAHLDRRRPDPGRADHASADRARLRRRLPAAAQRLLLQTRAAGLHQAARGAQPLPQRLVRGQLRRHPEGRRTHDRLVQAGLPSHRHDRARRRHARRRSTRPWPKSGCRRSAEPKARRRRACRPPPSASSGAHCREARRG